MIPIHEILHSIIGEGKDCGYRAAIIRTFGCNLHCSWCDTPQDDIKPKELSCEEILKIVEGLQVKYVLITGGEPLIHSEIPLLCEMLIGKGYNVIVETNGSRDISVLPPSVKKIMDLKPPSSGHEGSNLFENIMTLDEKDEIKIVISSRKDYEWAKALLGQKLRNFNGTVEFSPVMENKLPFKLAKWMIEDRCYARINLQIHKLIFPGGENADI